MSIFALQSPAGGFLDEELSRFNKRFDDWCVQFDNLEDAKIIAQSLEKRKSVIIVEITLLSYPQYFFHTLDTINTIYRLKCLYRQNRPPILKL